MNTGLNSNNNINETPDGITAGGAAMNEGSLDKYVPSKFRSRRKLSKKELKIILIPAFAAAAMVAVALFTLGKSSEYKFESPAVQYYGGNKSVVPAGAEITVSPDGDAVLKTDSGKVSTDLPLYMEDRRTIVLPQDMIYYAPREQTRRYKVTALTEVECKSNGTITLIKGDKSKLGPQGFLTNGKDFYLFLEEMEVEFNGYRTTVPALSYAEAVYGGYFMLFNYDTKEFTVEESDGTGTAKPTRSDDYVISLIGDSMNLYNDKKVLLVSQPDVLDPIF